MRHVAVPEPVSGRQVFARVLGGAFVLQHTTYDHPDFPDAMAFLSESACHYFDVRGFTRVFDLEINDAGWSMVRRDPDFWQRSTIAFRGPDAMEGTGENSHDGGESWEHDYAISLTRES